MKLAIFSTHPVQYHTALWRALAAAPGVDAHVFYFSDMSVRGAVDPGFGVPVAWDVPLLKGYEFTFLSREADLGRPWRVGLRRPQRLLGEGRFGAVLLQGYTHGFERQILRAAKAMGTRVVMRGEFADIRRISRPKGALRAAYLHWFYRQVDAFCNIGETALRHLERFHVPSSRIFFSPYSVDSELFQAQACSFDRQACRRELGLADDLFVILFSGKFIPRKEPLLLLEAIRRLPARDRIALIMLGDGELREAVLDQGRALLQERFIAPGFVNQSGLGRYFAAADLHALPSNHETWGLVVNEAMYFGLPSVVSDRVGCHPDLVRPGETGLVFRSGDAGDLARKMGDLVANPSLVRQMGETAKKLVARYSIGAARDGVLRALEFGGLLS